MSATDAHVHAGRWHPYPAYKPSGVEWLGDIPAHWEAKKIKRLIRAPLAYGVLKPDKYDGADSVPIVRILDVEAGKVAFDQLERISPTQSSEYERTVVNAGDLIVSVVGTIGRCFIVPDQLKGANLSRALARVQLRAEVNASFVEYYMQSDFFELLVSLIPTGTAQKVLNLSDLRNFDLPLPNSQDEITDIVAFLDCETTRLDALIAKKQRLIELLQEKRTALISQAVTRGLDPNVAMKDSGIPEIAAMPAHWSVKPLMWLTEPERPIMYGIVLPGPDFPGGIPIVKGGDVRPDRLNLDYLRRTDPEIERRYARSRLWGGDLVYAIRGSVGDAEIVPDELTNANLTQDAARVTPQLDVNRRWLLYALKSQAVFGQIDARILGATIRGINIRDLKRVFIPVPPQDEQAKIAEYLGLRVGQIAQLIASVSDAIDRLREYRTALISAAVTGKIDVRPSPQPSP